MNHTTTYRGGRPRTKIPAHPFPRQSDWISEPIPRNAQSTDQRPERIEEHKRATNREKLTELSQKHPGARTVIEASPPTRWIDKRAKELGHEKMIANPQCIPIITKSIRNRDVHDARILEQLGRVQPNLLSQLPPRRCIPWTCAEAGPVWVLEFRAAHQ
jgi:hypothetical protein